MIALLPDPVTQVLSTFRYLCPEHVHTHAPEHA